MSWQKVILTLKDRNVDQIIVNYCGGGDSGAIDGVSFFIDDEEYNPSELDIDQELINEIEELTNPLLENIEDWYNDEGGYGSVTINVNNFEYEIENHIKYSNYEDYNHSGNLTDLD